MKVCVKVYVVEVEVCAKVYMVEVKVEMEWMDDVFVENPTLSIEQHFLVKPAPLLRHHLKEFQLKDYILDLIFLDL